MKNFNCIIIVFALFFSGCTKDSLLNEQADQSFVLEINNAILGVDVLGNTASKTFIIFNHTGIYDFYYHTFSDRKAIDHVRASLELLEKNAAIVYWGQRCNTGTIYPDDCDTGVTIEDHEKDLTFLIETLRLRYGNDISIFLIGHGWGGTLALSWLSKQNSLEPYIKGCILSGSTHNASLMLKKSKQLLQEWLLNEIDALKHFTSFEASLERLENMKSGIDTLDINNKNHAYELMLSQLLKWGGNHIGRYCDGFWFAKTLQRCDYKASYNYVPVYSTDSAWINFMDLNLDDSLKKIDLPISLIWGEHDLIVPVSVGEALLQLLNHEGSEMTVFEDSHHWPFFGPQSDRFNQTVTDFVEKHK